MTPAGAIHRALLDDVRLQQFTRDIYLFVGKGDRFIALNCSESPLSSIGSISGSRLTATVTAWAKDYDEAHAISSAVIAALNGVSIAEEGVNLDGLQHESGPTDKFSELASGEIIFAIENNFSAQVRRV